MEKCFSREVQFLITNRQSLASLQRPLTDTVRSPSSVASPSPVSPGLFRVSQAAGVFDSSPAVPSAADNTGSVVMFNSLCLVTYRPHSRQFDFELCLMITCQYYIVITDVENPSKVIRIRCYNLTQMIRR